MARISSITSTVLPTPAPPNIAALPPWAMGASRSMALMPSHMIHGNAFCSQSPQ
jgi:hypothetical protein